MKHFKEKLLLYAITDRAHLGQLTLFQKAEAALRGGVTCLQLREKNLKYDDFLSEAVELRKLCKKYGVPLIINDNVEIAVKCGADGVHVGQSDMDATSVRKIVGDEMIIGVTAKTVRQAVLAQESGADYLGAGAVFGTSTKPDAIGITIDTLAQIAGSVTIPVVAVGGICEDNILKLKGSGISGAAVSSAVFASEDTEGASQRLCKLSARCVGI